MRICLLILIIFQFSKGQAFLGKVYNNIVVSNDSNEEDSLVASSAQTRQGDGGCQGGGRGDGRGGGGGGGCSGGRGKSGAGGPSNLGKDVVVTTNGPKAKIIVRKSKGSRKSVGTGSACSACCNQVQQGPPKVVYVPFCPHQTAASFPVPSYEPFHQSPTHLPSSSLNYPYSEQSSPSHQSTMYQPQSRALPSPPGVHHNSFDVEPMMASSAQPSPQFHRPTFQFPPPPLHPNPTIPFFSSHPSMPSNMQFATFHHSPPALLPPPVPFQYIPTASVYPPSQPSPQPSPHPPQPPSFDSTSSGSIRYPSPNPSSTSEASQYTAQMQSSPVSNNLSSDSHSQSHPHSTISQRYDRYKHKYPTSTAPTAASAREEHEMKDDFEFGRRTSPASTASRHDDDGPDYSTFESRHSVSFADPFAKFIAEHGHAKSPR